MTLSFRDCVATPLDRRDYAKPRLESCGSVGGFFFPPLISPQLGGGLAGNHLNARKLGPKKAGNPLHSSNYTSAPRPTPRPHPRQCATPGDESGTNYRHAAASVCLIHSQYLLDG